MNKGRIVGIAFSGLFFAAVSLHAAPSAASITENECVNGGGYVTEGSGCKFCVGGKLDLEEVRDSGKISPSKSAETKTTTEKDLDKPERK